MDEIFLVNTSLLTAEDAKGYITTDSPYIGQHFALDELQENFNYSFLPNQLLSYERDFNSLLRLRRELYSVIESIRWDLIVGDSQSAITAAAPIVYPLFQDQLLSMGCEYLKLIDPQNQLFLDQGQFCARFSEFVTKIYSLLETERHIINMALNPQCHDHPCDFHRFLLRYADQLIVTIRKELCKLQEEQVRSNSVHEYPSSTLDAIEKRSKDLLLKLYDGLWLASAQCSFHGDFCQEYENRIRMLVESCFVIESHPPQMVKNDASYHFKLRHFLSELLQLHTDSMQAEVQLLNDESVFKILKGGDRLSSRVSAALQPSTCLSSRQSENNQLIFEWRKLKLKNLVRSTDLPTVFHEKFFFVFSTSLCICLPNNSCINVNCTVYSSPIVIIKATKQKVSGFGKVLWDNMVVPTSTVQILPRVPNSQTIPLPTLLDHLDTFWKRRCKTRTHSGRGLDERARVFLTEKLFDHSEITSNLSISWRKLFEDKIPGRKFSFWKYFMGLLELATSEPVIEFWNKGYIEGFVDRNACETLLLGNDVGTFLLRFSQHLIGKHNDLGGLTLSFRCAGLEVKHLSPYSADELKRQSLSAVIDFVESKYQSLTYLYPRYPKSIFQLLNGGASPPSPVLPAYVPNGSGLNTENGDN